MCQQLLPSPLPLLTSFHRQYCLRKTNVLGVTKPTKKCQSILPPDSCHCVLSPPFSPGSASPATPSHSGYSFWNLICRLLLCQPLNLEVCETTDHSVCFAFPSGQFRAGWKLPLLKYCPDVFLHWYCLSLAFGLLDTAK